MFWLIPAREEIFDNLILIGFESGYSSLGGTFVRRWQFILLTQI
jgi:hypothetical protein